MNKDNAIIRLLGINRLSIFIANTDKGAIEKNLRKGEDTYYYSLDSVPLDKEQEVELLKLING